MTIFSGLKYSLIAIVLFSCISIVNAGNFEPRNENSFEPTKRNKILKSKEAIINTIVLPSRNHARMQPEIYYAFKDTVKNETPFMEIRFNVFNPFLSKKKKDIKLMKFLDGSVDEILSIKKKNPDDDYLFDDIQEYVKKNPKSNLARVSRIINKRMKKYQFLIIESSDTYGIHPMFYTKNITEVDDGHGAEKGDVIEALYDMFFLEDALNQKKIIWGTCHGSQAGYIHAGGKLGRIFKFKEGGHVGIVIKVKKSKDSPVNEEMWKLGKSLFTIDKDNNDYGIVLYPVPKELKGGSKKRMYINKDFQHSFGLVEPIPDNIKVLSYHPLSNYKDKIKQSKIEPNPDIENVLHNQVVVDAYKYKTMIGTQYHPQYTYGDLETAIVFKYLVKKLRDKYIVKKSKELYEKGGESKDADYSAKEKVNS